MAVLRSLKRTCESLLTRKLTLRLNILSAVTDPMFRTQIFGPIDLYRLNLGFYRFDKRHFHNFCGHPAYRRFDDH